MRKLSLLSLTAFTAVFAAGIPAMTSQAAMYQIPVSISGGGNCLGSSSCGSSGNCDFVNSSGCGSVLGGFFGGSVDSSCQSQGGNCQILGENCQIPGGILQDGILQGGILQGGAGNMPALPGGMENMPMLPEGNQSTPSLPGIDQGQPQTPDAGNYAEEILSLVNEERSRAGVSALTLDASAERAAEIRAEEIEQNFSHTRPDGGDFSTALSQQGVNFRTSGENIAYGQNSAEEVMQGWMNSSGHRANILNQSFTSIGVGHAEDESGTDYWTQLFFN